MNVFSSCYFWQKWGEIIGQAHQNVEFLKDQEVIRTVLNILQVHLSNLSMMYMIIVCSILSCVLGSDLVK